ncbi:NADPH:quinone oxidoreductase family protein [Reyranella sp.]|jgi:NADPH2:quinone reductase|uniref:NADPH:quinone oxidoreductase family protein n=1 Tax=Reyranella sp. TaxID=1929291 RepID=UPI000BCF1EDF|nr:NADPH:quinone oxidoreductase family protein [Reyranella sp.]OYY34429.1 MAG: quinone oxidoreductase [Rhodospirillales bacterium 35-66-84]OYZ90997.1 MAG: quinone oxidoreductase [Rhodospirillales bacterium 24-66-33]OZB21493.1 MAG: quinone oxidoreductase [Rhodospirillales bacterium 39-66-50]HQS18568.1 NADPH:quinone oxidoreductase family protein [Reyranella sp.]HQT15389.1 NADPH:quinone oxidoreductase family protein [Reyranella sp.]
MKAIQTADLSAIDNYALVDLPAPQPGEGEVRIKVAACGVGFVDALVALGRYQVKPSLPHVPGAEIGGVVDALGPGVTGFAIGERVLAQARGGFAEYAIASERAVSRIPDRMSMNQAAGFRVNYGTALHGLRDRAALKAGEILVVIGAAGGVGLAAVQVGRLLGANVIGVASTEQKRVAVQEAGAGVTLDRTVEGWRDRLKTVAPQGIDVVFDPVSGPLLQPAFRSLGWGGRYLVVGFAGGDIPALPVNLPLLKGAALIGVDYRQFGAVFEAEAAASELEELLAWVAKGELNVPVGGTFPFGEYREALEYALSGDGTGKTILVVDPSIG